MHFLELSPKKSLWRAVTDGLKLTRVLHSRRVLRSEEGNERLSGFRRLRQPIQCRWSNASKRVFVDFFFTFRKLFYRDKRIIKFTHSKGTVQ